MHNFFQFSKSFFGKIRVLLAFSFFVSGCHNGNEPVPVSQVTVKKEAASKASDSLSRNTTESGTVTELKSGKTQKRPETSLKSDASGLLLSKSSPVSSSSHTKGTAVIQRNTQRDPFALPAILQEPLPASQGQKFLASSQQIIPDQLQQKHIPGMQNQPADPVNTQEPRIAGIFDNGKEKFVLLHWRQIQGIFHSGEPLGNGYYIKEIKATSVLLCPQHNGSRSNTITLTL